MSELPPPSDPSPAPLSDLPPAPEAADAGHVTQVVELPAVTTTDGTAVLALVLSLLSWVVLPVVLAVVALVLARSAERSIAAAPAVRGGSGLVVATRWIAWVHLLVVAMVLAFLAAFFLALWLGR